ncbi:hypothetical protein GW916_02450 [bacterium]|nr:hypothetical protein [bacterium]
MAKTKPVIFYFRSLDTSGRDEIRVGPFCVGSFSVHFERSLNLSELDFVPVLGMGTGPLFDQAKRAQSFIENHSSLKEKDSEIHFFGHSAGGLVAKLVASAPHLQKNLKSLITVGTPNKDCQAAEWAASLPESNPKVSKLYQLFGYNFKDKKSTFESFHEVAQETFDFPKEIITGSLICAPQRESWSPLYRWVHKLPVMKEFRHPSDGLIQKESQYFGDHHWNFELDHIQQIGFGGQRKEFLRMCKLLEKIWCDKDYQSLLSREISLSASFNSAREAES